MEYITLWFDGVWGMLLSSATLLVIGLLLAGMISVFMNAGTIKKYLTGSKKMQVIKAALFGVPLPLCSCSVLPVAHQLRKSGVSKAGTVAFLISTPETGVDSIALTYSLIDPVMTVARPITAFITATAAGFVESGFDEDEGEVNKEVEMKSCCSSEEAKEEVSVNKSCCSSTPEPIIAEVEKSCCSSKVEPVVAVAEKSCCSSETPAPVEAEKESFMIRLIGGIKYGFTTLLSDLSPYLLMGYLLAGLVAVVLGNDFLVIPEQYKTGFYGYFAALLIGTPLYICATSSTPLAASLLAVGFSPGSILVFMLVGPATNAASLVVLSKILGPRSLVRYLVVLIVFAILSGIAIDFVYDYFSIAQNFKLALAHEHTSVVSYVSAIIISGFVMFYSVKAFKNKFFAKKLADSCH